MGFSHSWIAVKGLTREQALETLGMEVAEVREPAEMEAAGLYIGVMPDGWLITLTDKRANAFEGDIARLATFGPAVACHVMESVMYSEARGYDAGVETWRVTYDCEAGPDALAIGGNPPSQLDAIRTQAQAQQDAEDDADYLFDVPALLARSICGYMLGEVEPEGFLYSKLRKIGGESASKGGGFFARLFGRT